MTTPLASIGGAVSLNLVLRVFSFALTIITTRVANPSFRGAAFQVEMVSDTLSFISKDAVRSMYAAYSKVVVGAQNGPALGLLHISLLCIPLGVVVAAAMELLALVAPVTPISGLAALNGSGGVMLPAALYLMGLTFEFMSEPLLAATAAAQELQSRVWAESLAVMTSKAVSAVMLFTFGAGDGELTTLLCNLAATQQFVYGLTYLAVLLVRTRRSTNTTTQRLITLWCNEPVASLPRGVVSEFAAQRGTWWPLFSETIVRVVLTQCQKFVLAAYTSLANQGVYDTVNSLGGLVVRTVFRVLEDGAYNTWAAQMGFEKKQDDVRAGLPLLGSLLRICGYVGVLSVSLATTDMLRYALYLLFSAKWATDEAVVLLQWMCWYIPLLGANGQLEAFVRASSTAAVFSRVRNVMAAVSVLSIALSVFLVKEVGWGSVGLMVASVLSAGVRIVVSLCFMAASLSWGELVTRNRILVVAGGMSVAVLCATRLSLSLVGEIPLVLSLATVGQIALGAVGGLLPLAAMMVVVESASRKPLLPARMLLFRRQLIKAD